MEEACCSVVRSMADGCWNAQAESLLSLLVLLFRRPGRESSIFVQVELASGILEGKKGHLPTAQLTEGLNACYSDVSPVFGADLCHSQCMCNV